MPASTGCRVAPWLYTIGLFVFWEAGGKRLSGLPVFILPAPSEIFVAIVKYWSPIWKNSVQTLYTTTLGFVHGGHRRAGARASRRLVAADLCGLCTR